MADSVQVYAVSLQAKKKLPSIRHVVHESYSFPRSLYIPDLTASQLFACILAAQPHSYDQRLYWGKNQQMLLRKSVFLALQQKSDAPWELSLRLQGSCLHSLGVLIVVFFFG